MTKFTLTLLDTTGIQDYIFNSNRLQENIGASELVYRATTLWAFEALEKAIGKNHNIRDGGSLTWSFDETKQIEKDTSLQAEVIQAAGGNTLVLFRDKDNAIDFVKALTLRLLKEAPGLTILAQHDHKFDFETQKLTDARASLFGKMGKHKLSRLHSAPTLGLSVTAVCSSTGLPAVTTLGGRIKVNGVSEPIGLPGEDTSNLVSRETAAKRGWRKYANKRLNSILKNAADDFVFPYDLEKIGRNKGEESYVAVIHADGNRMGARVAEIGESSKSNREYINDLREFSRKINAISQTALEVVVGLVVQAVKRGDIPFVTDMDEDDETELRKYLPLRPLVFGGDDVTFVCNGSVGVSLAAAYLDAFEQAAKDQGISDIHACAGVSIVKMHYPFSRAYQLSEELTHGAKELVKGSKSDFSALDWHFAQSGLSGSLKVIRSREYMSENKKKLYIRPIALKKGADANTRSWDEVNSVLQAFNKAPWSESHNKVVSLREPLRKGPADVEQYRLNFGLGKLPDFAGASETGWFEDRCAYFDIIELLDHHVSLEPVKDGAK